MAQRVGELVLSLLWLGLQLWPRFDTWPGNLGMLQSQPKTNKQKTKNKKKTTTKKKKKKKKKKKEKKKKKNRGKTRNQRTKVGSFGRSHSNGFLIWGGTKQTYQSIAMASISLG